MKFKTWMIIKAIVCLGFAPVLLFVPAQLLNLLGMSFGSGTALTAREYGATLVGNLMLTWFARNVGASVARRAIILDLFIYDAIALVVTLVSALWQSEPTWLGSCFRLSFLHCRFWLSTHSGG